jgi:spermidine synthase
VLFASAFVVATCGLVYELIAGALASYLLGNSVTWWSLVIGTYLSAMGVGSWLSRFVEHRLLDRFIEIEVAVALLGGFEALLLFAAFAHSSSFRFALFAHVFLVGTLVGLEIPLIIRILEAEASLKELVARVLALDYLGALIASLAFPLVLVPYLGLFRTGLLFGLFNAGIALWATFLFEAEPRRIRRLRLMAGGAGAVLAATFPIAGTLETNLENGLFADPVVFRQVTPYQRVVVTHNAGDTRLFLDGALQFSSTDEYRYHEALVHPAMISVDQPKRVLVLGGGDGLAVREVLRYEGVESVTLVDLDPAVTQLFVDREELKRLNGAAFFDPRVEVVNADAFQWLQTNEQQFDVAIVDFPDPNDYAVGKLYTAHFFRLLKRRLADAGVFAVQSTSSFFSPEAYWCIVRTVESEGLLARPYHAYVPTFGEWGFLVAGRHEPTADGPLPDGLRFLDRDVLPSLFVFPRDMRRREGPVNRLSNQVLVRLYERDWLELWN